MTLPRLADPTQYEPFSLEPEDGDVPDTVTRIEKVEPGDTGWAVTFDKSTGFIIPRLRDDGPIPNVGDRLLLWGEFGRTVRGAEINGRVVFYRTKVQEAERARRWREECERKRKADYERDRAELDRRMAQLPDIFRAELEQAIKRDPDFRWEGMGLAYYLFALEQAVVLADHFSDEAAIDAWNRINSADNDPPYDYRAQTKVVPGWSGDHSGNTHDVAVGMAKRLVRHRREPVST